MAGKKNFKIKAYFIIIICYVHIYTYYHTKIHAFLFLKNTILFHFKNSLNKIMYSEQTMLILNYLFERVTKLTLIYTIFIVYFGNQKTSKSSTTLSQLHNITPLYTLNFI